MKGKDPTKTEKPQQTDDLPMSKCLATGGMKNFLLTGETYCRTKLGGHLLQFWGSLRLPEGKYPLELQGFTAVFSVHFQTLSKQPISCNITFGVVYFSGNPHLASSFSSYAAVQ